MNPPSQTELQRTPLAIVVDDQEWTARSLESILSPAGFAVLKAYTGRQALELVQRVKPDVLFVDVDLPDVDGRELCRNLISQGSIRASTPILALCTTRPPREQRLEILRSGAWDIVSLPLDPEELVLRLNALVRAKQEVDDAVDRSLLDLETGFYNVKGLMRRLSELTAEARRYTRPLACVVVGPRDDARTQSILREILAMDPATGPAREPDDARANLSIAESLSRVTRTSDAKGLLGEQHFVILAPDTDLNGAFRMAERVLERYGAEGEEQTPVCVGLYALENGQEDPLRPGDLLTRATTAFRRAQHRGGEGNRIELFRED
ncbi:MAG: response regulator [Gemmatimonadales bacterium]|nr:MAG: response regulator [Gemmatimonadales bacterium]